MLGSSLSAIHTGLVPVVCHVEADVSSGFPRFSIVGLPDSAVRESTLRIRSAFRNCKLAFPQGRITVNLTPANFRKHGSGLDLAIAMAILRASGQIPPDDNETAFLGELHLSGHLAPVEQAVGLILKLSKRPNLRCVVSTDERVPRELQAFVECLPYTRLDECVEGAKRNWESRYTKVSNVTLQTAVSKEKDLNGLNRILGRSEEKRLLSIAAAGRHPLLLLGPPGIGKTLLASHLPDLLPDMEDISALEVYGHMESKGTKHHFTRRPPVRAPHHSITETGMIGGGSPPRPGEVTLAHNGVLMLDELFEFKRNVLDSLRRPLLEGLVHLSRGANHVTLPADFLLIATANPCPCGYRGYDECRCLDSDVRRYLARCSGPMLDRIDLVVYMDRQEFSQSSIKQGVDVSNLRTQVLTARSILQEHRQHTYQLSQLTKLLTESANRVWTNVYGTLVKSERIATQLLRISETIAALDERTLISRADLEEAIQPILNRIRFGQKM